MTRLLIALVGLVGWAGGFSLLYAVHGLGCARGWSAVDVGPVDLHRLLLFAVWAASVAGLGWWTWRTWRAPAGPMPLLGWLARISAITGLGAMIVTGLPVLMVRMCGAV
ncbi:hypothetical protein [Polymorphobacter sp.]|uniref:hypothetical protein n=1 Tax=Polymorphobacter sp. TaxID=1909290 RepID=UPI003F720C11